MPTDNPKISGYVPQQIYDRFKQYQEENNLSMSQAVIVILAEYFGIEETIKENISGSPIGGVTLSEFQELKLRLEKVELEVEQLKSTSKNVEVEVENDIDDIVAQQEENLVEQSSNEDQENISSLPLDLGVDYPQISIELDGKSFAKRVGINNSKLSTLRTDFKGTPDKFTEWTTENDPDGITWNYKNKPHGKGVLYYPLENTNGELLSKLKEWITTKV